MKAIQKAVLLFLTAITMLTLSSCFFRGEGWHHDHDHHDDHMEHHDDHH